MPPRVALVTCALYPELYEDDLPLAAALEELGVAVEQARAFVLAAPSLPVYARVDGVVRDGAFVLMELEVFEPLMFLSKHPAAASRFALAVKGRLAGEART